MRERSGARNGVGDGDRIGAIEGQRGIVEDRACSKRAGRSAIADLQGPGADGGGSRIAVRAGEHRDASARLRHRARSRNGVGDGDRIGAVERQRAIVDDGACSKRARRSARADLQGRAAVDGGGSGVAVLTGQDGSSIAGEGDVSG